MNNKITQEDMVNWWLTRFHNTTLKEVNQAHPEYDSNMFYDTYTVTQQQHDQWLKWFEDEVPKILKISKDVWLRKNWAAYLDAAPKIKIEDRIKEKDWVIIKDKGNHPYQVCFSDNSDWVMVWDPKNPSMDKRTIRRDKITKVEPPKDNE